ncbi:TIGR00366 family protein [Citricoccus sp. NR2]|uniref:TIGR00366 family protein n=1 Tax=Citricoccus sp. NR2 TaxID=3004095 RepID=UPI0022DE30D4|nr:TIGR00366 family protein [Citricoccus sp. NR2]WBL19485.1 TIGR00366 family protein [Citricoccus sp. NR2]
MSTITPVREQQPKKSGVLERTAGFFTQLMDKYLPDPLVIAVLLTVLTLAMAVGFQGTSPMDAIDYWGNGFWDLLAFFTQMTVVLLTGYILAKTPVVDRLLNRLTAMVHSPRLAVITATVVALITSWLNWGFGLVMGHRGPETDYERQRPSLSSGHRRRLRRLHHLRDRPLRHHSADDRH